MRSAFRAGAMGVALMLAGCGQEEVAAPAKPPPAPPAAPAPPPGPPPPAYVGLWAAKAEMCPQGAWMFDEDKLATAGEVGCAFQSVNETASGFQITATCTAEGEAKPFQFTLTMTDPAPPRSMTVSRGPWDGPVTLVRCPG